MLEVSYGQLDELLRSLGFSVQVLKGDERQPATRRYEHAGTGALILLPVFPESRQVLPRHLAAVRATLDAFGVADRVDFDTWLVRTANPPTVP